MLMFIDMQKNASSYLTMQMLATLKMPLKTEKLINGLQSIKILLQ